MSVVNVLFGLLAAVVVYLVCTAVFHFQHANLVFGLIALVVFFAVALGNPGTWIRR